MSQKVQASFKRITVSQSENCLTKWWQRINTKQWLQFWCRKINFIWNLNGCISQIAYKIIAQYHILQGMKNCFLPPQENQLHEARRFGFSSLWRHITRQNSPGERATKDFRSLNKKETVSKGNKTDRQLWRFFYSLAAEQKTGETKY